MRNVLSIHKVSPAPPRPKSEMGSLRDNLSSCAVCFLLFTGSVTAVLTVCALLSLGRLL